MTEHREFIGSYERMGDGVWSVDDQIANVSNEVVRCGECKFYLEEHKWCYHFEDSEFCPEPDGYCAWGERRDVE